MIEPPEELVASVARLCPEAGPEALRFRSTALPAVPAACGEP